MTKKIYEVERRFELPIGHRLNKNKGLCKSIHGHNIFIYVKVGRDILNENDMVIDFSDLKRIVQLCLVTWDHALFLNKLDEGKINKELILRVQYMDSDPTAEKLCEILYNEIKQLLPSIDKEVKLLEVRIFENENSQAIYREEVIEQKESESEKEE